MVAVAATQFDETTTFYSNWGKEIDIAAPGGNTRVDQNGDGKPDGVLQHTDRPRQHVEHRLPVVHGDVDGFAAHGGRGGADHGRGRHASPTRSRRSCSARRASPRPASSPSGRVDDHYGAGIVDASAALKKARDGRGAGEFGLAGAVALLGIVLMRRRGIAVERLGPGFVAALIVGSSGLFFLPGLLPQSWSHAHAVGGGAVGRVRGHDCGALGSAATRWYSAPSRRWR